MAEPTVIAPGAGEVVGDSPERRVEILSDHDALHATWSRFGPGRAGADLHVHRLHTDLFYVLEGELTVLLADGSVAVPAGTLARVPPLVVHGFRNDGDAELRYLNLHAPGVGFADFMRALRDGRTLEYDQEPPPAEGTRPSSEAVVGGNATVVERQGRTAALLADVEAIAIAETHAVPDVGPAAQHVHRRHVESLYVIEGELAVKCGDRELRAGAGTWVQLPPDVPHALACAEPVRYLELHAPSCGFGAFVRGEGPFDQEPAA